MRPHHLSSRLSNPDLVLTLLFSFALAATGLLGWRLLLGALGLLGTQHGLHLMAESCLLMLNSPNLPDRLLAYSLVVSLLVLLGRGVWALASIIWRTTTTAGKLQRVDQPLPVEVVEVAERVGLTGRVLLVPGEQPFAFCYGLVRRRVCISQGLLTALGTGRELEAVLWHEGYHLHSRDPLKMVFASTCARAFFFSPVVDDL